MRFRPATAADQAAIIAVMPDWWGGRDITALLQPLFLAHFASTSLIAEDDEGAMAGFLVGFPSVDDPRDAYVHFIGVRPDQRGSGLGRELHERFASAMADRGVTTVRCVTNPINAASIAFHQEIGFEIESTDPDYVHFVRRLPESRRGLVDPRPDDTAWPTALWPVPDDTVLVGRHVTLTPSTPADANELFAALDDDAAWAHVRGRPATPAELAATLEAARAGGRWPWTVRRAGAVVGTTSFLEVSPVDARLEIGFTLYAPSVWGTEVNPECKLLLMTWDFEEAGMGRVQLKTDIRNARSQAAIAKLGAQYEGILRRYQRRQDGSVRDTVLYSVTAEEWPAVKAGLRQRLGLPG